MSIYGNQKNINKTYYGMGSYIYRNNMNISNYNNTKFKFSKINDTRYYNPIKLERERPITDSDFAILDTGSSFTFDTGIGIGPDANNLDQYVYLNLYLKFNNNTVSSLDLEAVSPEITSNKIYLLVGSDVSLTDDMAIVSFDVNEGDLSLTNPVIHQAGSFLSGAQPIDQNHDFTSLKSAEYDQNTFTNNGLSTLMWLSAISSITHTGENALVRLGTVFKINRFNNLLEDLFEPEDDASFTVPLRLNNDTINITGGSNYLVGDTFRVSSDGIDGEITVEQVDGNGSILTTYISNYGSGFITEPSVTYNGTTGSSANILLTDNYSLLPVQVTDGGNGYCFLDEIVAIDPITEQPYFYTSPQWNIQTVEVGVVPYLNNELSIDSVKVHYSKADWTYIPQLFLINIQNNTLINNTFINFNFT